MLTYNKANTLFVITISVSVLVAAQATAADFTITNGQTSTTAQFISAPNERGVIDAGGAIDTTVPFGMVSFGTGGTLINNGTIHMRTADSTAIFASVADNHRPIMVSSRSTVRVVQRWKRTLPQVLSSSITAH